VQYALSGKTSSIDEGARLEHQSGKTSSIDEGARLEHHSRDTENSLNSKHESEKRDHNNKSYKNNKATSSARAKIELRAISPAAVNTVQVKRNLGKSGLESEEKAEHLKAKIKTGKKVKSAGENNVDPYLHLSHLVLSKEHMEQAKFLVDCGIWEKYNDWLSSEKDFGSLPFEKIQKTFSKKPTANLYLQKYMEYMLKNSKFAAHWKQPYFHPPASGFSLDYTIPYRFITEGAGLYFIPKVERGNEYYSVSIYSVNSMGECDTIFKEETMLVDLAESLLVSPQL
jgi:hypothetical protein